MNSGLSGSERHYLGRSAGRILIVAFGILLVLMVVAGWDALTTLATIHTGEQSARLDFLSRSEPIIQVRTKLTLYGDLVQKSVVLTTERPAAGETDAIFSQIQSALDQYPHARRPEEQALIEKLQAIIADQDRVSRQMLALHDQREMKELLGAQVLPSRLRAIEATEQIAFWNDSQFRAANASLLTSFNQLRDRLKRLLFVLLGSGLAISLGSIILIAAQEKEIRKRYMELAKNRDAQAELSARLLDAQEQERRAISRELHDEVSQSLGALLVDMGRLSSILPPNDAAVQDEVRKIRQLAESSVSAVRNIALLLRPSMLDDLGLVAAIEWQAPEISRRSDVEVEVQAEDIPADLREDLKMCIYRVTQEALNNVARHSGARHARVNLHADSHRLELKIRDDGKGFDPRRARGLGMLGMEERVRLLQGSLNIDSRPGGGTEVIARLPLA